MLALVPAAMAVGKRVADDAGIEGGEHSPVTGEPATSITLTVAATSVPSVTRTARTLLAPICEEIERAVARSYLRKVTAPKVSPAARMALLTGPHDPTPTRPRMSVGTPLMKRVCGGIFWT